MFGGEGLTSILKYGFKNVFKQFMCTVYKPFHDECLKNITSITLISLAFFYKCLKKVSSKTYLLDLFNKRLVNVFSKNVCT